MTEKEKARAAAATAERDGTEKTVEASFPVSDHTTSTEETQPRFFIAELLPQGEANAVTTEELLRRSGFTERREMTKEIERERLAGALILSKCCDGGGYYLPKDGEAGTEELRRYCRTLSARAKSTFRVLRAARLELKARDAQPRTEGDPNG